MHTSERPSRHSSVKRSRSLSESFKGLFKSSNNSTSNHLHSSEKPVRPPLPSVPSGEEVQTRRNTTTSMFNQQYRDDGRHLSNNAFQSKNPTSTLHVNTTMHQNGVSPLQSPLLSVAKPHHLPNIAKLSLSPSSGSDVISQDSYASESNDEGITLINKKETPNYSPSTDTKLVEEVNISSIDAMLETNGKGTNNNNNTSEPERTLRRPHRNSIGGDKIRRSRHGSLSRRSQSLKKSMSSNSCTSSLNNSNASFASSSNTNIKPIYSKGRKHAESVSASNLTKYMEMESKCIINVDNFKVFSNGYHQHNLKTVSYTHLDVYKRQIYM